MVLILLNLSSERIEYKTGNGVNFEKAFLRFHSYFCFFLWIKIRSRDVTCPDWNSGNQRNLRVLGHWVSIFYAYNSPPDWESGAVDWIDRNNFGPTEKWQL